MILIVTPYGPQTGSGNWRTASRHEALLTQSGLPARVHVGPPAPADLSGIRAGLLLHARRSHLAAERFRELSIPYAVVLTGTDLYGDLQGLTQPDWADQAQQSIRGEAAVVGLQSDACECLQRCIPDAPICRVIAQTSAFEARPLAERPPSRGGRRGSIEALLVGHVRPEKDPLTAYRAIATLVRDQQASIHLRHLGGVLDAALDDQLRSLVELHDLPIQRDGQVSHDTVESAMQSADLLIAPSRLEGGALVLAEAVAVGLPVVASRIPGHIGILGEDHPGWFPQGDAQALAARIGAWIASPRDRAALQAAGETVRYRLTDGAAEAASLVRLLRDILGHGPQPGPQPPVKNAPRHD